MADVVERSTEQQIVDLEFKLAGFQDQIDAAAVSSQCAYKICEKFKQDLDGFKDILLNFMVSTDKRLKALETPVQ